MEIKQHYSELSKKNKLPEYTSFAYEFGISEIKDGNFNRKIAEKIIEKVDKYREILQELMQPQGNSLAAMIEMKSIGEEDSEEINKVFSELTIIERNFLLADLANNDDMFIEFIRTSYDCWDKNKASIIRIIKIARDSWKENKNIKNELGYLG